MPHILPSARYAELLPMLEPLRYRPAIDAIAQRTSPATVYVDALDQPSSVFVIEDTGPLYVAGHSSRSFADQISSLLHNEVVPALLATRKPMTYLTYSPSWKNQVNRVLEGLLPIEDTRVYYELSEAREEPTACYVVEPERLPEGFRIQRIGSDILPKSLSSDHPLREELDLMWPSLDRFAELGFGYGVVHNEDIVSWCLVEYVSEHACGIGIETLQEYQGKGLATAAATACVEEALDRGWTVYWDAWQSNKPSIAVAEKVGFTGPHQYPVAFFWFNELDALLVNANWHARSERFEQASMLFDDFFDKNNEQSTLRDTSTLVGPDAGLGRFHKRAGQVHAQAGYAEKAISQLQRALELGAVNQTELKQDPTLSSLHQYSEWKHLTQQVE